MFEFVLHEQSQVVMESDRILIPNTKSKLMDQIEQWIQDRKRDHVQPCQLFKKTSFKSLHSSSLPNSPITATTTTTTTTTLTEQQQPSDELKQRMSSKKYWMPDKSANYCYDCQYPFSFFKRKHHCRICGQIFCWKCSNHFVEENQIRVCNYCFDLYNNSRQESSSTTTVNSIYSSLEWYLQKSSSPSSLPSSSTTTTAIATCSESSSSSLAIPFPPQQQQQQQILSPDSVPTNTTLFKDISSLLSTYLADKLDLNKYLHSIVQYCIFIIHSIKYTTNQNGIFDITKHVHCKVFTTNQFELLEYWNGILLQRNVIHKKMKHTFLQGCHVMCIKGSLEYVTNSSSSLYSMDVLLLQEYDYLKLLFEKLTIKNASILFVEKSVNRFIIDQFNTNHNISIVCNIKYKVLERIASITNCKIIDVHNSSFLITNQMIGYSPCIKYIPHYHSLFIEAHYTSHVSIIVKESFIKSIMKQCASIALNAKWEYSFYHHSIPVFTRELFVLFSKSCQEEQVKKQEEESTTVVEVVNNSLIPDHVGIIYYSDIDMSIGHYLMTKCFAFHQWDEISCTKRCYIHNGIKLMITVHKNNEFVTTNTTMMIQVYMVHKYHSSQEELTQEQCNEFLNYSFGKFLENNFYQSIHKDYIVYFVYQHAMAKFETISVPVYQVCAPPLHMEYDIEYQIKMSQEYITSKTIIKREDYEQHVIMYKMNDSLKPCIIRVDIVPDIPIRIQFSWNQEQQQQIQEQQEQIQEQIQEQQPNKYQNKYKFHIKLHLSHKNIQFLPGPIIVREEELSSIIAYTLNTREYYQRISEELKQEQDQINLTSEDKFHFKFDFEDAESNHTYFSCTCYFAKQFATLRKLTCQNHEFIHSLSRCKPYKPTGGKSKSQFIKTWDDRYVLKTISRVELINLIETGLHYFEYMNNVLFHHLPSLLAKLLGLYRISYYSQEKNKLCKYDVIVMENIFYNREISKTFDLKGSMRNRYQTDENAVLLDENMMEFMNDGSQLLVNEASKSLLRMAIYNDTLFLSKLNVMDYSLLVGMDEKRKELVVGIIDYLRKYTWDKQLETWVKSAGASLSGNRDMSAIPTVISPKHYKKRFRNSMERYFILCPTLT